MRATLSRTILPPASAARLLRLRESGSGRRARGLGREVAGRAAIGARRVTCALRSACGARPATHPRAGQRRGTVLSSRKPPFQSECLLVPLLWPHGPPSWLRAPASSLSALRAPQPARCPGPALQALNTPQPAQCPGPTLQALRAP